MMKYFDERYESMPDEELLRLVREHFKGERPPGVELLNRHFPVGYARAAKLVAKLGLDTSGDLAKSTELGKPGVIRRPSR